MGVVENRNVEQKFYYSFVLSFINVCNRLNGHFKPFNLQTLFKVFNFNNVYTS